MTPRGGRPVLTEAERQRIESVDRLAARGGAAIGQLVEMLSDPSWVVRRGVVAALAALGDPAVPALCRVLAERRDDEARVAATVDALAASTGDVETAASQLLEHPSPAVVADAAQVLGRRHSPRAVPLLARLVDHPDDNVAVSAIEALGRVGGRAAVDQLVVAARSGSFFRTFPAIDVLGRSGDPRAVEPLAALLEQPHFAFEAARALGRTGEKAAVAPLASLLGKGDTHVRLAALAIADLFERYRERNGTVVPVVEALRAAVPVPLVTERLRQSLASAELPEQTAICTVLGALGSEAAVPALTHLLNTTPPITKTATEALARVARASDELLVRSLREGDSARRLVILPIVSHQSATEDVARCLADRDAPVRAAAAEALARIGNPAAVPALFERLGDPNPRVVQAAVAAIQSLGSDATRELALRAARAAEGPVRRAALRILGYFGFPEALPIFLEASKDADPRARDSAIQGLAFLDDPRALESLLELAKAPDERVRASAMRSLGQGSGDPRAVSALLRGLSDGDAWVRYYACQALGRLGVEAASASIAALLGDEAGQVRVAAVEALSHLESDLAAASLRSAAGSPDADVQRAALIGLGIGARPDTLELLVQATSSADPATRLVAVSALAGFPGKEVLPALARAAGDADESVRTAAIGFLAGRPDLEATQLLVELLARGPSAEKVLAALAIPSEGRITGLIAALESADDEAAPLLTSALARMHRADATAALFRAFRLPSVPARKAAASALGALGTREALDVLAAAASGDPDPEVRRICALLLGA